LGSNLTTNLETAWMEPYQIPAVRNIPNLNGILGNALLSRFRTVFDIRRGRLILGGVSGSSDVMTEIPD